jgi:hypothetical membrane protein
MAPNLDRLLIISGFLGPIVFFLSILVFGSMFPGYSHTRDYISELGAVDSPVKNLMNIFGFFLFGLLLTLYSIGVYRAIRKDDRFGKIAALTLILAGIFLASIAFFPCDAGCENWSKTGEMHEFTSDGTFYLLGLAALFFAISSARGGEFKGYWPFFIVIGIAIVVTIEYASSLDETVYGGLAQRLSSAIPVSLMWLSSVYLYRSRFKGE